MVYNEQQLESFSKPAYKYEHEKIIVTHHAIREAINLHFDTNAVKGKYGLVVVPVLDIYLQGSYSNSTTVTKSSDVDLVVQMETIWHANKESLSPDQLAKYDAAYSSISYTFQEFNAAIFNVLRQYFGAENVLNTNKCLIIQEHGKYCKSDIIPCFSYRHYGFFEREDSQRFTEGMYFITNDWKFVRNFPKEHSSAVSKKSEATNGAFKETVRMFKNIRDDLTDRRIIFEGIAKSYYIENLLYNFPDTSFSPSRIQTFEKIMGFLIEIYHLDLIKSFKCANGIDYLFSQDNWNYHYFQQFLVALIRVKDETQL